ncbi:MAG: 1-aminocyclopropane-1-carboxylate deaminase/D-cysteine desulfhydrase [Methylocystis sp.]|uniref:1-aminocyclopropane-1-carboxylate deaminase/D-cysteine desulfhydrase n=1 Tax=Methylocystis sp. TaxID=1911079 RepID=UPI003DA56BDB
MTGWAQRLEALPRLGLVVEPTPLHPARRQGAGARLWFKRDDLIPAAFGGNKVRALDLVMADALDQRADTLITGAGPLSNHVRASAAVAALAGLACVAVYWGAPPPRAEGNQRLARLFGAELLFTGETARDSVDAALERVAAQTRARGGAPYVVPRGGACPLAVLAHVRAVRETLAQCAALGIAPDCVVMAVGGAATLAGWLLGSALFEATWRIDAFSVSRPASEALQRARRLAQEAAQAIGAPEAIEQVELRLVDDFIGAGYGLPSSEGQEAIAAMAREEAILLDPVYTGKAMAGRRSLLARGAYDDCRDILFLHTGGAPALFTAAAEIIP